jgi:hypothetical protein
VNRVIPLISSIATRVRGFDQRKFLQPAHAYRGRTCPGPLKTANPTP